MLNHLVLFAHPRSGSSSLYQILALHPDLRILEEPFNEHYADWDPQNIDYRSLVHDTPSLDTQLAQIFTNYNGIKLLDYQLPDPVNVHLLQRSDCTIIFLRRRNLLQAVVSVLIAHQTGLWKKWDMTKPIAEYYRQIQPLDIPDIQRRVRELKQHLNYLEAVLDQRINNAVVKLTYEDLFFAPLAQQHAQIAALWQVLALPPLAPERYQYYLQPEAVKINSTPTYAWLSNAHTINHQCGNDVTGWLYE